MLSATLLLSWRLVGSEGHGSILLALLGVLIVLATWSGVEGSPYLEARTVKSWKLQVALCDHVQVCPDEILISVYPNPNEVRNRLAFLRDYRLAHFAPKFSTFVPHDALDPAFDPKSLPDCAGTLDGVDRLSGGRFQVRGWMIWPGSAGEQPEAISIFSDMGKRLGGGGVCELRKDVKRARFMPLPGLIRLRLSGYRAWAAELSEPFYVVGVFANGTRRCKLRFDTSF